MYMCKYDFIFVMPTYNPFHWLSLAHDCVLYNMDMGSYWDYFPVESPKMAVESDILCRYIIDLPFYN